MSTPLVVTKRLLGDLVGLGTGERADVLPKAERPCWAQKQPSAMAAHRNTENTRATLPNIVLWQALCSGTKAPAASQNDQIQHRQHLGAPQLPVPECLKYLVRSAKFSPTWKVLPWLHPWAAGLGRYGCRCGDALRIDFWEAGPEAVCWAVPAAAGKNAELSTSMGAVSSEPLLRLMCRRER